MHITDETTRQRVRELAALRHRIAELEARQLEHVRTEEALRASEDRLRVLLETTKAIPWEADAKTWQFTYVGPQAVKLLGYPLDKWREKDFWVAHIYPEDRERAAEFCQKASRHYQDYEFEYRMIALDGRIVWIHDIVNVVTVNGEPEMLRGFMIDITAWKQAEENLRDSEARYRTLVEHAPEAIVVLDVETGRFVDCNQNAIDLFGLDRGKLLSIGPLELSPRLSPSGRPSAEFAQEKVATVLQGDEVTFEWIHLNAKGQEIPCEVRLVQLPAKDRKLVRGSITDITERKRAEETLRQSRERFELLSETASQLLSSDNPQQIINHLCRNVMTHTNCDVFFNYLVDDEKKRMKLNAYCGIPQETAKEIEWLDYGVAICGTVARDGYRIVAENVLETPEPRTDLVGSFGIKAYACYPLFSSGRVIGTLSFGTRTRIRFAEDELELMKTVADQVAVAMERELVKESLKESEDFLKSTLDALSAHVAILDECGTIVAVNAAWRRFAEANQLGLAEYGVGKNYLDGCSPTLQEDAELARAACRGIREVLTNQRAEFYLEYPCHSPEEERWFQLRATRFENVGSNRVVIAHEDVTELKRAEAALREQTKYVHLLQKIAVAANEAVVVDKAIQVCLDEVCALTGWPVGHAYGLANDGSGELVSMKIWHQNHPKQFEIFRRVTEKTRFKSGIGLPGRVLDSGKAAWVVDVDMDPNFPRAKVAEDIGIRAGFAGPVLAGKDVVAVLEFFSTETVEPDQRLLEVMGHVGTQLGRVIERKRLERGILEASEREQRRIGQDLHDGLSQHLTGVAFLSKGLAQKLESKSKAEAADAAKIAHLINQAIVQTRDLARGLYPVHLEAIGLVAALQELADQVAELFNISCRFWSDPQVLVHDNTKATHLYYIAREAVNNAIKHGKAQHVEIGLTKLKDETSLTVKDDGVGFPETVERNPGMGLHTMRHRARMIGASLALHRDPGGGTIMTCSFRTDAVKRKRAGRE